MRSIPYPLIIFLFLLSCLTTHAQVNTKISGIIKSADGKPIESATVSLLKSKDSSLVKVALPDKEGTYLFEKIKSDNYLLKIESIGFNTYFSNAIHVTDNAVIIPEIKMETSATQLKAVTLVTHRPLIENKIDKIVVNVDASATNGGLSALEVLEKSPGVTVDNDGNILIV